LTALLTSLQLFSDPTYEDLLRYYQAGSIAAYEHVAMIKLHYSISDALEDCIAKLEGNFEGQPQRRPTYTLPTTGKTTKVEPLDSLHAIRNGDYHSSPVKIELPPSSDNIETSPSDLVTTEGFVDSDDENYEDLYNDDED
jgi:hypothetical protein